LTDCEGTDGSSPSGTQGGHSSGGPSETTLQDQPADAGAISGIAATGFIAGTHIATLAGEIPVERLQTGFPVLTFGGRSRPIVRFGAVQILASPGRHGPATPIIVRKGALADKIPGRDLRVMKSRALYVDGDLIPVELLVNHRTILWDDDARLMTIYRVELQTPDILLANGAPAESYRDDAANGPGALTGGPQVDAAWMRLLERAGGQCVATTDEPEVHLRVDGRRLNAASQSGDVYRFGLAARPAEVRIVSRSGVPQELGVSRDPRRLGVAVGEIVVLKGRTVRTIAADDPSLAEGFHAFDAATGLRWTDGDASVPVGLFDRLIGPLEVFVRIGGCATYAADLRTRRTGLQRTDAEAKR
jgi:hypothetical protein